METQLIKFQVQNFRSIIDSGWVNTYENTCLIGTNESGKTNLLVGLWNLNPASDERIIPLIDYPRKKYVDFAKTKGEEIFVSGHFLLNEKSINFVKSLFKKEQQVVPARHVVVDITLLPTPKVFVEFVPSTDLSEIIIHRKYNSECTFDFPKMSEQMKKQITMTREIERQIMRIIPKFVYYSDYGNLDSEIYLPHVIANFTRNDLGERERAKTRSLKVLFDFVQLSPEDILRLGKEKNETHTTIKIDKENPEKEFGRTYQEVKATDSEIAKEREHKKEREILLQSASTKVAKKFKEWWKQGNYRFRFQADGNHFRIWVSDHQRPEEVELEGRSKGLQWFFSFFLVFLVESRNKHSNCILLLDEPGLSLHPLAQYDLIKFFNSLSAENQLIYTTHSPFLVSLDNLANVKAVFVDKEGDSTVSGNLKKNSIVSETSTYPIRAAIGLSITDTLLIGAQSVLVNAQSDQIYMMMMKNHLCGLGLYKSSKEMIFIPAGGLKGMTAVIAILAEKENEVPYIMVDCNTEGRLKIAALRTTVCKYFPHKVLEIDLQLGKRGEFTMEDFLPYEELAKMFSKRYRGKSDDFDYVVVKERPIVQQMEEFAKANGYHLDTDWKVLLATDFKNQFQHIAKRITEDQIKIWTSLFTKMTT